MVTDAAFAFLEHLLQTPSPSGFEEPNSENFRRYVAPFADSVTTDSLGNVIAAVNPEGSPRIMLAGHIDEIGFLISYISDEGYCYLRGIGGHDNAIVVGQRVTVHSAGGPVQGVIGKKPIHVLTAEEKGKAIELYDLWVDLGITGGREEVRAAGVRVGDPVTYSVPMTRLQGDCITGRALDNRIGAWVVAEALHRVRAHAPRAAVFAVATVQEEIGLRGAHTSAFGIAPHLGIAVDVTFASDYPSMDKRRTGDLKVGGGPTVVRGANANRRLADRIISLAEANDLPYQVEACPAGTGTDANAMQVSRAGITAGIIGIPLRYMHTPCELISLADADNAAELLALTCASLRPEDNWIP